MKASYSFFGQVHNSGDGEHRVTIDRDLKIRVDGGAKEVHGQVVEFLREVSKEFKKDPPQTGGEFNCVLRRAARKIGTEGKR